MVILYPIFRPRITLTFLTLLITYFLGNIEEETQHSQDKISNGTNTPTEFQNNRRIIMDDALNIIYRFKETFHNREGASGRRILYRVLSLQSLHRINLDEHSVVCY